MNQRQKKKSSQHRKRHFDAVKAKESGHQSGGQKQQTREQAKPQPLPTSQSQSNKLVQARDVASVAASPVDSNAPPRDQRKTFSRRKVVSNWEKYDEERLDGDPGNSLQESEEALQDRLLQLFNLPVTHAMPSLTHISDDQISTAAQELDNDDDGGGSSFLTLDFSALAEALSTLPLHQRLDIDPELFPEEKRKGEFVSKTNMDFLPSTSSRVDQHKNVILLRDGHESDALDLTKTLKKRFPEKVDAQCRIESDFSSVETERQTIAPIKPVAIVNTEDDPKYTISTKDEERELDKLLQLSKKSEVKSRTDESSKPTVVSSPKSEGETLQSSTSSTVEIKSLVPMTVDDETSELDDMLDELLA